jgi:bifunctional UDP-N-acetylglucosamine pyrophosphorylase/glucosamine-1-phosphate N-acetyltransferase
MSELTAIILAAGQGKRMKSALPKVLHPLAGLPMIHYVVEAAAEAGARDVVVVVGHGREEVRAYLEKTFGERVRIAVQEEQLGTGHAARCALPLLPPEARGVFLLYGDTPLIEASLLRRLADAWSAQPGAALGLVTCSLEDPTGYGRVLRDEQGRVRLIREQRDCSAEEATVREVNPGVYLFAADFLKEALPELKAQNAQGEFYLTDTVEMAAPRGMATVSSEAGQLRGINDRAQLDEAEEEMFRRIAARWRRAGATIRGSARVDATVLLGEDCTVEHGAVLRGASRVGGGARIDVGVVLEDSEVGARAVVKPYSVLTRAKVADGAQIGPMAHLRPGSVIGEEAHVGNFVETKNTVMHRGAKANHLAYLGDSEIGEASNVGAGTIFCNYDGFQKHKTTLGARVFVGSDSQIVAPVTLGDGAYVATGTTVTRDVPPDGLAIGRTPQQNKEGYAARLRGRLKAQAEAAKAKPKP